MITVIVERDEVNRVAWIEVIDNRGRSVEMTPEIAAQLIGKRVEVIESRMGHELGLPQCVTWEVLPS